MSDDLSVPEKMARIRELADRIETIGERLKTHPRTKMVDYACEIRSLASLPEGREWFDREDFDAEIKLGLDQYAKTYEHLDDRPHAIAHKSALISALKRALSEREGVQAPSPDPQVVGPPWREGVQTQGDKLMNRIGGPGSPGPKPPQRKPRGGQA